MDLESKLTCVIVLLIAILLITFGFLFGNKQDNALELKNQSNQYETNINKIENCVQNYHGYKWLILGNQFVCFNSDEKMTYKDETGMMN